MYQPKGEIYIKHHNHEKKRMIKMIVSIERFFLQLKIIGKD